MALCRILQFSGEEFFASEFHFCVKMGLTLFLYNANVIDIDRFLDAIISPGSYPCQRVSEPFIVSDCSLLFSSNID